MVALKFFQMQTVDELWIKHGKLWPVFTNSQLSHSHTIVTLLYPIWIEESILIMYVHAHHVPHAEHVEMAKLEAWSRRHHAVLCLSHPLVSERSKSLGADGQVVPCHGYPVFHPFVEQLTIFYRFLSLDLFWRRLLSSESLTSTLPSWAARTKKYVNYA